MNHSVGRLLAAIALLSLSACQAQSSSPAPADAPGATPADLPAGISLSDDGQAVVMASGSTLEAYCIDGQGKLAIAYAGEAGGTGQLVGCGQTFDGFDAARANGFADVTRVAPAVVNSALRLQDGEFTKIECQADHAGLSPVLPDSSDGHMTLECL